MLLTRVMTAAGLLLAILPILFLAPPAALAGLMLLIVALAAWEWARLTRLPGRWGPILYAAVALGLTSAWYDAAMRAQVQAGLQIAAAAWVVAWALLAGGVRYFTRGRRALFALLGWVMLPAFMLAVMQLRAFGIAYLLSVVVLVWSADIGAYFIGRAIGRHRLAPSISPGKSWEGALGGGAVAVILAVAAGAAHGFAPTWFSWQLGQRGAAGALTLTVALVAASIAGDLFESLLKRQAGAKDSSRLLPGHGGVLDRIDALLPVLPLAALLT